MKIKITAIINNLTMCKYTVGKIYDIYDEDPTNGNSLDDLGDKETFLGFIIDDSGDYIPMWSDDYDVEPEIIHED